MPSDPEPLPNPRVVYRGIARTIGSAAYWMGAIGLVVSGLTLLSLHVELMDVAIAGIPAEMVERAVWAVFGFSGVLASLGVMIGVLTSPPHGADGGPQ